MSVRNKRFETSWVSKKKSCHSFCTSLPPTFSFHGHHKKEGISKVLLQLRFELLIFLLIETIMPIKDKSWSFKMKKVLSIFVPQYFGKSPNHTILNSCSMLDILIQFLHVISISLYKFNWMFGSIKKMTIAPPPMLLIVGAKRGYSPQKFNFL